MSPQIPFDVLEQIVSHLKFDVSSLRQLATTSRQLNDLSVPLIFADVKLDRNPSQMDTFCRTVIANPRAGRSVTRFSILQKVFHSGAARWKKVSDDGRSTQYGWHDREFEAAATRLAEAIRSMPNMRSLKLDIFPVEELLQFDPKIGLALCSHPSLVALEIGFYFEKAAEFLEDLPPLEEFIELAEHEPWSMFHTQTSSIGKVLVRSQGTLRRLHLLNEYIPLFEAPDFIWPQVHAVRIPILASNPVARTIHRAFPNLRHLISYQWSNDYQRDGFDMADPDLLPNLESVDISIGPFLHLMSSRRRKLHRVTINLRGEIHHFQNFADVLHGAELRALTMLLPSLSSSVSGLLPCIASHAQDLLCLTISFWAKGPQSIVELLRELIQFRSLRCLSVVFETPHNPRTFEPKPEIPLWIISDMPAVESLEIGVRKEDTPEEAELNWWRRDSRSGKAFFRPTEEQVFLEWKSFYENRR